MTIILIISIIISIIDSTSEIPKTQFKGFKNSKNRECSRENFVDLEKTLKNDATVAKIGVDSDKSEPVLNWIQSDYGKARCRHLWPP